MQIVKIVTMSGKARIGLQYFSRRRADNAPYVRRAIRLTEREYQELFQKIVELAPADMLRGRLRLIEGR